MHFSVCVGGEYWWHIIYFVLCSSAHNVTEFSLRNKSKILHVHHIVHKVSWGFFWLVRFENY